MFALQVDYKRVSDRHTSAYVAPRHSHDGKFSVSLCAGHGLGVATRIQRKIISTNIPYGAAWAPGARLSRSHSHSISLSHRQISHKDVHRNTLIAS